MARASWAPASRRRRKRVLKQAKGFRGGRRKLYRQARETVLRAMVYATRDRRVRKRSFRQLWVARIHAACLTEGTTYSQFMHGLEANQIVLNRKSLADLAQHDAEAFRELVALACKTAAA